jgi:outer membrane murein-binding lipoprotein Lpp
MLERTTKLLAVLLISSLLLPGCSNFTKSGRQAAAYQRYLNKASGKLSKRDRQRLKLARKTKKAKIPKTLPLSEPKMTTTTASADAPQSISAGGPPGSH